MTPPIVSNTRKLRPQYGYYSRGQVNRLQPEVRLQPEAKSGWLATLGRALKDNAALIAALLALAGVLLTQIVTTNNAERGLATQRELEEERALEAELQTYLDNVGVMLLDEGSPLPKAQPGGPMRSLARAKTLTVLERSDPQSKGIVLQFLYESQLIQKGEPVVSLREANLSDAALNNANLREADLTKAILQGADLQRADLRDAILNDAALQRADLTGGATLRYADLTEANLTDADLTGADLRDTILRANLSDADLRRADLRRADLSNATGITDEQLAYARSLKGATMPDGSTHE